ncbi:MAG: hypothetical protein A2033_07485 [Bacteroidetes bacterium GWA2_31_9]|nr:MAG: hypothetical protein A2033_07485 [Bacteroidetes bacterium GWA2_31_9]
MRLKQILFNRNVLLLSAMLLGIFAGDLADSLKEFASYDLLIMMTVSFSAVSFKQIFNFKKFSQNALLAFAFNYLLFGSLLMLLAYLLLPANSPMIYGFLFIALAPPGVVIVPFSQKTDCNKEFSVIGTLSGYLIQIIIFPVLIYFLNVKQQLPINFLLWQFSLMLVFPLLISRVLRFEKAQMILKNLRGRIIDITFFILIYIVIGITRKVFFTNITEIVIPLIILLIMYFPMVWILQYIMNKLKISEANKKSYILMFVVKNNGVSAMFSLLIVGEDAAVPSAVLSVVLLIFLLIYLNEHQKK